MPWPPFDFCAAMRTFCESISQRVPEFSHVRVDEIAITFAQARQSTRYGLQAKLTPLRFENGSLTVERDGERWTLQRLFSGNHEYLYILTFYLPRFQNQTFREKLVTVFHELHHISPRFDGDIRRFDGRYYMHSPSQGEFDRQMAELVDSYMASAPPPSVYAFLRSRFATLVKRHGGVVGQQTRIPKLVRLYGEAGTPGSRRRSA